MKVARRTLTLNVAEPVAARFREAVESFDGRIGICAAAAMILFIRAGKDQQQRLVQQVFTASMDELELVKMMELQPLQDTKPASPAKSQK